jgi:hypothetical protein
LGDAQQLAVHAADDVERTRTRTAEEVRVWGGLLISAVTSTGRAGDYEQESDMFKVAEDAAGGDAEGAVKTLESLLRRSPQWMRHHTLAVAIVRDLWASPVRPPGLRTLAEFLGVIG